MAKRFKFSVLADYQQFYLLDDDVQPSYPEIIEEDDLRQRFKRTDHLLAVYTEHASTMTVVVTLEQQPPVADTSSYDHMVRTWIDVPSGRLILAGCSDYLPDCPRIAVPAGRSNILVAGRHIADATREAYEITLWPSGEAKSAVLKQFRRDA